MRDEQLSCDLLVGQPGRHQAQHLGLAFGQLGSRWHVALGGRRLLSEATELAKHQPGQPRREDGATFGGAAHGFEELLPAG